MNNLVKDIITFITGRYTTLIIDKISKKNIINIKDSLCNNNELLIQDISSDINKICNNYTIKSKTKHITEDFGKKFEMAICLLYNINYDGNYKYSLEDANILKDRIRKLKDIIPYNLKHIASCGNPHDFKILSNDNCNNNYLSAKTCKKGKNNSKKNGKVAPQIIGQASKKKFYEYFKNYINIDINNNIEEIKDIIIKNINILLDHYTINTFNSPIIYYNETRDTLYYIKQNKKINWNKDDIHFTHIIKNKNWNESSSIKINNITIGEFQVHNNRDNIKFRWNFENLLNIYKDSFCISLL